MNLKNIEATAKIAAFMSAAAIGLVGLGVIETVKLNKQLKNGHVLKVNWLRAWKSQLKRIKC